MPEKKIALERVAKAFSHFNIEREIKYIPFMDENSFMVSVDEKITKKIRNFERYTRRQKRGKYA